MMSKTSLLANGTAKEQLIQQIPVTLNDTKKFFLFDL